MISPQAVSLTTWALSFLMIVPIFLYAHTQQVTDGNDFAMAATTSGMGGNLSTLLELVGGHNLTLWNTNRTFAFPTASPTTSSISNSSSTEEPDAAPVVSCNIYWPENEYMNGQAAFTLYTFTLAFAIPLILILVFYILVIRKLQVITKLAMVSLVWATIRRKPACVKLV